MLKIQHGIAGFFAGAFLGLLIGMIEMRFIDIEKHPAMAFILIALTVIILGVFGIAKGLQIAKKKMQE